MEEAMIACVECGMEPEVVVVEVDEEGVWTWLCEVCAAMVEVEFEAVEVEEEEE